MKLAWDKYETALLVEAYWKIKNGVDNRQNIIESLSITLRQKATIQGLQIDDVFRNVNGISYQLALIESLFSGTNKSMHYASVFEQIVELYKNDREAFNDILAEAHNLVSSHKESNIATKYETPDAIPIKELQRNDALNDFVEFCLSYGLRIVGEINNTIYIAYRTSKSIDQSAIKNCKELVANTITEIQTKNSDQLTECTDISSENLDELDNNEELSVVPTITLNSQQSIVSRFNGINKLPTIAKKKVRLIVDKVTETISIESLGLSVRSTHILKKLNVNNVQDLMELSEETLLSTRNCGVKSVEEIIAAKKKIIQKESNGTSQKSEKSRKKSYDVPQELKKWAARRIRYCLELTDVNLGSSHPYWKTCLQFEYDLNRCVEVLGPDLCKWLIEQKEENSSKYLIGLLNEFSILNRHRNNLKYMGYFKCIDEVVKKARPDKLANLYLQIHNGLGEQESQWLVEFCSQFACIEDIENTEIDFGENAHILAGFLDWLQFDINAIAVDLLNDCIKKKSVLSVLDLRSQGYTLEAISKSMNVTRERIRQIENHAHKAIRVIYGKYRLLDYISAVNDYNTLITDQVVLHALSFDGKEALLYLLKAAGIKGIWYDKNIKCFCHSQGFLTNIHALSREIQDLPEIMLKEEFDNSCEELSLNYSVQVDQIREIALQQYRVYKKFYSKTNISLAKMYDIVLEKYYPAGIRLCDDELAKFLSIAVEEFGELKGNITQHAIESRISDIAILCDRRKYIHPSHINVPKEILDSIVDFIQTSSRKAFAYSEIFERFKDELLMHSSINNRYYLQGVMKLYLSGSYYFSKDYFSKVPNYSIDKEVEKYIENAKEVHFDNVLEYFRGITVAALSQTIARLPSVINIDGGNYIHCSTLDIRDQDYLIKDTISANISDIMPISSRKLLNIMYQKHSDFLERNRIFSHTKLYGILNYMFRNEFGFSRPYIGTKSLKDVSRRDIILTLLGDVERISIEDVKYMCDQELISYYSTNELCFMLEDYFLRVNEHDLISCDTLDLTESNIQEMLSVFDKLVDANGWIAFSTINDFMSFPNIGVQWNSFLLKSIIHKYSGKYKFIDIPTTQYWIMNTICVPEDNDADSYESFLHKVLLKEQDSRPFESVDEFTAWLNSEGLILSDISVIILNCSWITIRQNGSISIEGM